MVAGFAPMDPPKGDEELARLFDNATFEPRVELIDSEEMTEGGNAHRLEMMYGNKMRYCHTHKKWFIWDDGRWQMDTTGGAMRLAANVVGSLYIAAAEADGKDERNAIIKFAKETDTRKGLTNMLALAGNRLKFAVTADMMDSGPWHLGAGNVTIDLKTSTIREPHREDLISKAIGTTYDKAATCPLWDSFLCKIFPDEELRNYVKRAFGYCLTGSTREQVFFFCYGMGANGKSVLLAILRAMLGDYAKQADFSTFLVQRNEKVRNDLAALAGARVITAIEAEEGGRLSMQVIKSWTGGDPVTARFLFAENFTFQPTGKIWLAANNKPAISEKNIAAWRRVRLIPFNVIIPEAEQDRELEVKLLAELPGILNWALDGLREYREHGLGAPKVVLDATAEYRRENDSLEQFVSECCDVEMLKACKNMNLYGQYLNFCGMSGLEHLSQTKFSPELSNRPGISRVRNIHGITWVGIDLKPEWKLCRVETNPTSQSEASKDVDLVPNALSNKNSSPREDFTPNDSNPTPHNDSNPTCTLKGSALITGATDLPPLRRSKHLCKICNEYFDISLVIHEGDGYICERCRRGEDSATGYRPKASPQCVLN